jgi:hypothetical protein
VGDANIKGMQVCQHQCLYAPKIQLRSKTKDWNKNTSNMQWFQYFMESEGALTNGITLHTSLFKQFELF